MADRTIIVTGAGQGIGRAIALACGRRGWRVALLDRDADSARQAAAEVRAAGAAAALGHRCDVADEASVADAFEAVAETLGVPDGLVANAGIEVNGPLHELDLDDWEKVLRVNLTGCFLTVRRMLAMLLDAGLTGSIVCLSSPSAFTGFAGGGNSAYGASKGGVSAFVRSAAIDYARHGIRVNALVPGATDTPLLLTGLAGSERERRDAQIKANAKAQIPLGRLAAPEEIAAAALWLLSADSSYVTGSNLVCDGGLLAKSANDF